MRKVGIIHEMHIGLTNETMQSSAEETSPKVVTALTTTELAILTTESKTQATALSSAPNEVIITTITNATPVEPTQILEYMHKPDESTIPVEHDMATSPQPSIEFAKNYSWKFPRRERFLTASTRGIRRTFKEGICTTELVTGGPIASWLAKKDWQILGRRVRRPNEVFLPKKSNLPEEQQSTTIESPKKNRKPLSKVTKTKKKAKMCEGESDQENKENESSRGGFKRKLPDDPKCTPAAKRTRSHRFTNNNQGSNT